MNILGVIVPVKEKTDIYDLEETYDAIIHQIVDGQGIGAKFNAGIEKVVADYSHAPDGWVIFTHDDVSLVSNMKIFEQKLDEMAEKGADIVTVAGSTVVPPVNPGYWWYGITSAKFRGSGAVIHKTPGEDDLFHVESYGPYPQEIAAFDGLWFAVKMKALLDERLRFDAKVFDGYHYYDADFAATARSLGYKIWVTGIMISHNSIGKGMHDPVFLKYQQKFIDKWKSNPEYFTYSPEAKTGSKFVDGTSAF